MERLLWRVAEAGGLRHLEVREHNGRELAEHASFRARGNQLLGWVQLARLRDDGSLDIPDGLKVVLEVGANSRNTLDQELLPRVPKSFAVSFEPLLDKWATAAAWRCRSIAPDGSAIKELKISGAIDGCASLLDAVASYYSASCTNASGVLERRAVPSVSLEVVLREWLPGRDVALTKVDAQGLDLGVVRSAGAQLHRLEAIQLEVVRDRPPLKCKPQYAAEAGRPSEAKCGVVVSAMAALGYEPYDTTCEVHRFSEARGCEAEMLFVRRGRDFDDELVRPYCARRHSCGPSAWSRGWRGAAANGTAGPRGGRNASPLGWGAATMAWALEVEKRWGSGSGRGA